MRCAPLKAFDDTYVALSENLKKKVDKQLEYLVKDLRHPSLRAKKYDEAEDIWQARIDGGYRFYFKIEGDVYILLRIKKHTD